MAASPKGYKATLVKTMVSKWTEITGTTNYMD